MEEMSTLKEFLMKLKDEEALQTGFRQYMGKTMQGMDGEIAAMQRGMNAKIKQGFLDYSREVGFPIKDDEMDALMRVVGKSLHEKMHSIFQQEFAAAIAKTME